MNTPSVTEASIPILQELVERYRKLYEGPEIDAKLERLSREVLPANSLPGTYIACCGRHARFTSTPMWKWCRVIIRRHMCGLSPSRDSRSW